MVSYLDTVDTWSSLPGCTALPEWSCGAAGNHAATTSSLLPTLNRWRCCHLKEIKEN